MVFTVLVNIILCPFSHISIAKATSLYVLVQDVSSWIVIVCWQFDERVLDVLMLILNSLVS